MPGAPTASDALRRFGGMYGSAWAGGNLLQEAIEVSGNMAIARIEVPLVGSTRTGYKAGRETREGTMRIQVIDSSWAMQVWTYINARSQLSITTHTTITLPLFSLMLQYNDPEAYDMEQWQLDGVQVWQMPVGFAITDDITQREIPITWEDEKPLHVFEVSRTTGALTTWDGQGDSPFPLLTS